MNTYLTMFVCACVGALSWSLNASAKGTFSFDISSFSKELTCGNGIEIPQTLDVSLTNESQLDELKLLLILRQISTYQERGLNESFQSFLSSNQNHIPEQPAIYRSEDELVTSFLIKAKDEGGCPHTFLFFRGTADIREWVDNLKHTHVAFREEAYPSQDRKALVHKGFYTSFKTFFEQKKAVILEEIEKTQAQDGTFSLWGYSRGAAMAMHTQLEIQQQTNTLPQVITFGGPRIGNDVFAQDFLKDGQKLIRFVHGFDPVTHIPPANSNFLKVFLRNPPFDRKNYNFRHGGDMIWYKADATVERVPFNLKEDLAWDQDYWTLPGLNELNIGQIYTNFSYHMPERMLCRLFARAET